jgi:hypothetical protein
VHATALQGQDYRGDVVYEVIIRLEVDPVSILRWGMTAEVEIDTS